MRCSVCDNALQPDEIVFNPDLDTFEICSTCLNISLDAAYSDGFTPAGNDKRDKDEKSKPPFSSVPLLELGDSSDIITDYTDEEDFSE